MHLLRLDEPEPAAAKRLDNPLLLGCDARAHRIGELDGGKEPQGILEFKILDLRFQIGGQIDWESNLKSEI